MACAVWLCCTALILPPSIVAENGGITVGESGVGTGVVDRELQGVGDSFPEGAKVWFWVRVVGAEAGDQITHVWMREGREVHSIALELGGSHWRTWSSKTLHPGSVGAWAVEARDAEGSVLAREEFRCVPATAEESTD
jgi:hypothetical protein